MPVPTKSEDYGPYRAACGLVAALSAALAISLGLRPGPAPAATVVDCRLAVTIDGALHCGDAVPATVNEICPGAPELQIRAGDNLERATLCTHTEIARGGPGWTRMSGTHLASLGLPVNLHEAGREELASLPGIGPALAGRIIEARERGELTNLNDLDNVRGIGPRTLSR
ncbi:MAG: ComEA family DNA-binding protein, partial [Nannocystaceae bacterium]